MRNDDVQRDAWTWKQNRRKQNYYSIIVFLYFVKLLQYHSITVFGWLHSPPRRRNLQVPRVRYQPWCIVLVLY